MFVTQGSAGTLWERQSWEPEGPGELWGGAGAALGGAGEVLGWLQTKTEHKV